MKVVHYNYSLQTKDTLAFHDITEEVEKMVKKSGIENGIINIQSLHTTMAVLINEHKPLVLGDMKKVLERIAPSSAEYQHDNFNIRTVNMCYGECQNGQAHCKAITLPTSVTINIVDNKIEPGQWQRIFLLELDKSRTRKIGIQILGI